ncbi:acyltransferase family protein [Candidatus Blastococcus massiliensis]|uniref:acyltransferase family protein n=1 Tax=Candidatus Blastococcus massiliensis TaxID=1470358 RepID=UPI0004BC6F9F|nr:acyltransferase [Candidatus Blastococcus massiliensis]
MTAADELGLAARPSGARRLLGIEGLRGIAALLVLFRHVGQHTTDEERTGFLGQLSEVSLHGLTLFFVLSGFLLFRPFAQAVVDGDPLPSIRRYAVNRALRILPAYLVIFVLVALVVGVAYTEGPALIHGADSVGRLTDPVAVALNLGLLQTYVPGYILTGIGPAWSLSVEVAFYVSLPLLALSAGVLVRRRVHRLVAVLLPPVALIGVGLATTLVLARHRRGMSAEDAVLAEWGQTGSAAVARSLLAHADLFGYGMLAALLVVYLQVRGVESLSTAVKAGGLVLSAGAAVAALAGVAGGFRDNLIGVAAAGLLAVVVLPASRTGEPANRLARALEWAPARYAGLISYSVYLWHLPVISWLQVRSLTFGESTQGLVLTTLLVMAIVAVLASATYWLVERPALQRRAPWPVSSGRSRPASARPSRR